MSVRELGFRLGELSRIQMERRRYPEMLKRVRQDNFNFFRCDKPEFFKLYQSGQLTGLLKHPDFMRRISPPLTPEKRQDFIRHYPDRYQLAIRRADQFLQHEFSFLGAHFKLPEQIPWQCDPISLKPYPTGFYRDIDIFTNRNAGDVKHVWEINRLQFLIEIAKAYYLTDQDKYRQKLDKLLADWNAANSYKSGVAWASALEVGVRALALTWILNFYTASNEPTPDTLKILIRLLYLSGEYLYENLSIYFSPYNHLIGENAGLFAVGYLFPGFKNSAKHEKAAWKILEDQIERQFHTDGGSVEQATFYHHFTLGFFIQAVNFKRLNGDPVPQKLLARLEKALEFAMRLTRPDGELPHIGDIDDARSIYFGDPTNWDFKAFQSIGAAWFKRADMKFSAGSFAEDAFWMLSDDDANHFKRLTDQQLVEAGQFLKESGYALFRDAYGSDVHFALMDCGPLAHGVFDDETPSAAHGHADLLSIEISAFGEALLIDPGFSNYRGAFDWHAYFRSTAAHNTFTIDGQSQAKQGGILVWSHAPKFKVLSHFFGQYAQGICAEHYGYERLADQPIHRRYFMFINHSFWLTFDEIFSASTSADKHDLKYNLHFHEAVEAVLNWDQYCVQTAGQKSGLSIHFFPLDNRVVDLSLAKGGENPGDGWNSPTYLAHRAAPLVTVGGQYTLPFRLLSLYLPVREKNFNDWIVNRGSNSIELQFAEQKQQISFGQLLARDQSAPERIDIRLNNHAEIQVDLLNGQFSEIIADKKS